MKILIYGAGAVGSFLGGHLAFGGHDVTLLGRGAHVAAVNQRGLTLQFTDGSQQTTDNVRAVDAAAAAFDGGTSYDWIAFTMKSYDTAPSVIELSGITATPPPIISFQNGVGNEDTISSVFGAEKVASGTLTTPVAMPEPGVIREEKDRGAAIALDSPSSGMIVSSFNETSLPVETVESSVVLKWSKLLLNMLGNATSAILDLPPGDVFAIPEMFGVEYAALRETLWILEMQKTRITNLTSAPARTLAHGVRFVPQALLRPVLAAKVRSGRGGKLPSLLKDLRAGQRRTEVAWLNGAVAAAASRNERIAPVNHALALTVSDIAAGRVDWDRYRQQPEQLMAVIRAAQGMGYVE